MKVIFDHFRTKPFLVFVFALCFAFAQNSFAQQSIRALFVGNSYTEVNNLPQMVADIAASMGNELHYQSNTPGGCTFQQHCNNQSMTLIRQGGWDIVVLQEQSQYPSFPQQQVENEVFPYAQQLVNAVYDAGYCTEPMFYMTWGRKNGDQHNAQYFPVLGTYEGMDSMLCLRYTYMAETYDAALCPVGRVWNHLRHSTDIELYQADESHPSLAGTYAAACAFYTMFFGDDPDSITYLPSGLNNDDARLIRNAAHDIVFLQLPQWKRKPPKARFSIDAIVGNDVTLVPLIDNADTVHWNFGDGTTLAYPTSQCQISTTHHYAFPGTYNITLTASRHCITSTATDSVIINSTTEGIEQLDNNNLFCILPNPISDNATINTTTSGLLAIISDDGRIVQRHNIQDNTTTLNLSSLKPGVYLIQLHTTDGVLSRKIVKL
ncbi:MAG: T9SS type A sorting domain-containing protein [Bacteroidales bacterium]|nr:T9SS type A sorting domain-containing protein [Bacteroidales bacterium]